MRKDKEITGFKPTRNRFWPLRDVNQVSGTDRNCVNFIVSGELQIHGYRAWLYLRKNTAGVFRALADVCRYVLDRGIVPAGGLYANSQQKEDNEFFELIKGGIECLL
jgi:hypothetical protein